MDIRKIWKSEIAEAMDLVWETFLEFEAPNYSAEGIKTFKEFIGDQSVTTTIEMHGAFEGNVLAGVIATRNEGTHISLFFVRKEKQGQGVGRKLFEYIEKNCTSGKITVNSSPYAANIYHKLGFIDLDTEQLTNGLRYIPMQCTSHALRAQQA